MSLDETRDERRHRAPLRRSVLVGGCILAGALSGMGLLTSGCENNARDAHCSPDNPSRAEDPDCLYGNTGKGPILPQVECPPVTGDLPTVCPSFYDVLDVFADPERGSCTLSGCHGVEDSAAYNIYLPVADPGAFYEELLETHGSVGRPFVVADNLATPENEALESWIICNLEGTPGGGSPMPKPGGMSDPADLDIVRDWVLCGAEPPQECVNNAGDGACVTCAKDKCCGKIVQCLADNACAACAVCIQQTGDLDACAVECDMDNARTAAISGCVRGLCVTECPGVN